MHRKTVLSEAWIENVCWCRCRVVLSIVALGFAPALLATQLSPAEMEKQREAWQRVGDILQAMGRPASVDVEAVTATRISTATAVACA